MFVSFFEIAVNRLFRLRQRRVVAVMNNSSRHATIHTICRHLTISLLVAAAFLRNTISLDSFPIRSDRHCPFAAHSRSSISSARFQPKPFSIKRLPTKAGIHVKSLLRGPMSALSIRVRFHGEAQKTQAVGRFDGQKRQYSRRFLPFDNPERAARSGYRSWGLSP